MSEVFCDDLRVTVPADSWMECFDAVMPVVESLGAYVEFAQVDRSQWRFEGGTFRTQRCGRVWSVSASGAFLAALRARSLFAEYLGAMGSVPHTVTGLHATMDVAKDTPPILAELLDRAYSPAGIHLTRKGVAPRHVQRHMQRRDDGQDTGTVYFGGKAADVRAVVYDKRMQLLDVFHDEIGEPRTRYELRLRSGACVTLRDAHDPESLFWHYMAPDFLPLPSGVAEWVPFGASVDLPPLPSQTPWQRLAARVYASDDLAKLIALAESCGPEGIAMLCQMIRARSPANSFGVGASS